MGSVGNFEETPTGLVDPTSNQGTAAEPAFALTQNGLQDLVEYKRAFGHQLSVIARVDKPPGAHLCYVTTQVAVPETTWSSYQTDKTHHAEFNSALVYLNHSCDPSVELEVYPPNADGTYPDGISGEFRVVSNRPLRKGDELTWFYPSTEFNSPRPFDCMCGAGKGLCIGTQKGSKYLSEKTLDRYFINKHVRELRGENRGYATEQRMA